MVREKFREYLNLAGTLFCLRLEVTGNSEQRNDKL